MVKILLIDNQPLTARGIESILPGTRFTVVHHSAINYSEIIKAFNEHAPQLLLIDPFSNIDINDDELRQFRTDIGTLPVIALTNCIQNADILRLLNAGIRSHVCKEASPEEIIKSIQVTGGGDAYLCNRTRSLLFGEGNSPDTDTPSLSPREKEIIQLIADGKADKEIADALFLSYHTIRTHRKNISKKLGFNLKNAAELIVLVNSFNNEA